MAHTPQSKKRIRIDLRNQSLNKRHKTIIKNLRKNLSTQEDLSKLHTHVDRAMQKGVFHRNKAARIKSQTAKQINQKGFN